MIEQVKTGDKLTVIKVNGLASTTIREITIDSTPDGKIIFAQKRKRYYLKFDSDTLILNGHNLGITQGTWDNGGSCFLMDTNCNIGGLDRELMITLLKTNINDSFNQWNCIHWFDGTSDKGDPLFIPRPVSSNYLMYQGQAEDNKPKSAQQIEKGQFIYSYSKGSKHNNLTDMLTYHLDVGMECEECSELGKVVDIIDVSDEEFDALQYSQSSNLLKNKGGTSSDDIAAERDNHDLSPFEMKTFYSNLTLIRTPSGRAITVDASGHDYMRYIGLLYHYKESMKVDCERVNRLICNERERDESERIEKDQEKARLEKEDVAHIEKEYAYLTVVTGYYDYTTAGANIRSALKTKFSRVKFSVVKRNVDTYYISWTDGPPVSVVDDVVNMFVGQRIHASTNRESLCNLFMNKYGFSGYVVTDRIISESSKTAELDAINKELETSYTINDYVSEKQEYMSQLVHKRTSKIDYSPKLDDSSTPPNNEQPDVTPIKAGEIKIVPDYSEKSFAIIGDTKPIKETLKQLGGRFNSRLSCGVGWVFSKTKLEVVKQTLCLT